MNQEPHLQDEEELSAEDIYIPRPQDTSTKPASASTLGAIEEVVPENSSEANSATIAATAPEESPVPAADDGSLHDASIHDASLGSESQPMENQDSQITTEEMTGLVTGAFMERAAGVEERKLVSRFDTTGNLSYKRVIASSIGNQIGLAGDECDIKNAVALKLLDKIRKRSPQQELPTILSSEEVAVSVLDDAAFNAKWKNDITRLCDEAKSQGGEPFIGNDEIAESARMTGRMWRAIFRRIIVLCTDPVNAYRLSRPLQLQIDYVSPLEAHLIGEVVDALDEVSMKVDGAKEKLNRALEKALKNRNVGRSLVQSSGPVNILWHAYSQISFMRTFILASRISTISFPPPSENFLSARRHALNSILRQVLGPGRWFTRLVTGGREEFVVDDDNAIGQNLAAESNGFEFAMRQQYGNYFGRQKINAFRAANRLPTDESVVRTFTTQPESTLVNNGAVHVLRAVAKHWESILSNPYGVFGNQRMEMLDVRQMLRFHMPVVLLTLANLRGLNSWDTVYLGPLVNDLMHLGAGTDMDDALALITRVKGVVQEVCGGVSSRSQPFEHWLHQMEIASTKLMEEKVNVKSIISSVSVGIEAGYNLAMINKWQTPSDAEIVKYLLLHIKLDIAKKAYHKEEEEQKRLFELGRMTLLDIEPILTVVASKGRLYAEAKQLKSEVMRLLGTEGCSQPLYSAIETINVDVLVKKSLHEIHNRLLEAILQFIAKDLGEREKNGMSDDLCKRALEFVTPRDKRTLIELVMKGLEDTRPARLLIGRAKTLLRRDLRRVMLDERIESIEKQDESIPFAESIVRAQKAFMTIELDCTRMFAYNAFMEFEDLRSDLRKLQAISQIQCRRLDDARMRRLVGIRDSEPALIDRKDLEVGKQYFVEERPYKYDLVTYDGTSSGLVGKIYKVPPQNMLVVGGGPSGLLTTLHCLENCKSIVC